ncbi:hypothetical protein SNEBB_003528 [Seison nebaliae]|nr:hypothetical protein SNEBB_003528 [Seison nebaliae]
MGNVLSDNINKKLSKNSLEDFVELNVGKSFIFNKKNLSVVGRNVAKYKNDLRFEKVFQANTLYSDQQVGALTVLKMKNLSESAVLSFRLKSTNVCAIHVVPSHGLITPNMICTVHISFLKQFWRNAKNLRILLQITPVLNKDLTNNELNIAQLWKQLEVEEKTRIKKKLFKLKFENCESAMISKKSQTSKNKIVIKRTCSKQPAKLVEEMGVSSSHPYENFFLDDVYKSKLSSENSKNKKRSIGHKDFSATFSHGDTCRLPISNYNYEKIDSSTTKCDDRSNNRIHTREVKGNIFKEYAIKIFEILRNLDNQSLTYPRTFFLLTRIVRERLITVIRILKFDWKMENILMELRKLNGEKETKIKGFEEICCKALHEIASMDPTDIDDDLMDEWDELLAVIDERINNREVSNSINFDDLIDHEFITMNDEISTLRSLWESKYSLLICMRHSA